MEANAVGEAMLFMIVVSVAVSLIAAGVTIFLECRQMCKEEQSLPVLDEEEL